MLQRMFTTLALLGAMIFGCGTEPGIDTASNTPPGGSAGVGGSSSSCSPGDEWACSCYGVPTGKQTCLPNGQKSVCPVCDGGASGAANSGGSSGSGGGAASGGSGGASCSCSNGVQDCDETGADCGGSCPACGPVVYLESDCIKAARNGSEICDDAAWKVEAPGNDLVLVCITDACGTIYAATNTGPPDPVDSVKRCQGWEKSGQNAWDHLAYLHTLVCTQEQQLLELDLSAHVGKTLYFGAHNKPTGGGQFTHMCIAKKK